MSNLINKQTIVKEIVNDESFRTECIDALLHSLNSFESTEKAPMTESSFSMLDSAIFNKLLAVFTSNKLLTRKLSKDLSMKSNEHEKQANTINNKTARINSLNSKFIDIKNNHLIDTKKYDTIIGNLKSEIINLKSKYDHVVRNNRSLNSKEEVLIKQNGLKEKTIYKLKTLKLNNKGKTQKRAVGCEGFTIITLNNDEPLYIKDRIADNSMTINNLDNNDFLNEEKIPTKKRKSESRPINLRLDTEATDNSLILNQKEGIDVYQIVNNYEEEIRIYKDSISDIKMRFDRVVEELSYLFKEFVNTSENTNKILGDFENHLFDINRINLDVFEHSLKQHIIKYKSIVNSYGNYKRDRLEKVENNYKFLAEICCTLINAIYKTAVDKSVTEDDVVRKELKIIYEKDLQIK